MIDQIAPGTGGFLSPDSLVGSFSIQNGMSVADFGAGSGYFTILMARLAGEDGQTTAVDILDSALDAIHVKAEQNGLTNIQTVRANLEVIGSSGLADKSQDFVLLANVLFQSELKENLVGESHRVLKDEGRLVVLDWKKGTGGGPADNLRMEPTEMQTLVEQNGFKLENKIDAGMYHYGLKFLKVSTRG